LNVCVQSARHTDGLCTSLVQAAMKNNLKLINKIWQKHIIKVKVTKKVKRETNHNLVWVCMQVTFYMV